MTNATLKPCPFCGGEAELLTGEECAYVQCLERKRHRGPFVDGDNNAANEAVREWNGRADYPDDVLRAAREAAAQYLHSKGDDVSRKKAHAISSGKIDRADLVQSAARATLAEREQSKRIEALVAALKEGRRALGVAVKHAGGDPETHRVCRQMDEAIGKMEGGGV